MLKRIKQGFYRLQILSTRLITTIQSLSQYSQLAGSNYKWRLKVVHASTDLPYSDRKICIYSIFQHNLSTSSRLLIESLHTAGYTLVVVNNAHLNPADQSFIDRYSLYTINRDNVGRDIGALKDTILFLRDQNILGHASSLVFFNDSIHFISKHLLDQFLDSVDQHARSNDALFTHHSLETKPHYQSYFFCLNRTIFTNPKFYKYWEDYIPLDSRYHSIKKGEILFSELVCSLSRRIHTIYTPFKLMESLLSDGITHPISKDAVIPLLPSPDRTYYLHGANTSLRIRLDSIKQLFDVSTSQHLSSVDMYLIVNLIENSNPSHVAAFLYAYYLGCPFLKKDLVFAGTFGVSHALNLIRLTQSSNNAKGDTELDYQLLLEYGEEVSRRGTPISWFNRPSEAYRKGLVSGYSYPMRF